LIDSAKTGLLSFGDIVDTAMLGLRVVEKYTKPVIYLLESLGKAANFLKLNKNYSENKELQFIYNEIIQRIRQVGHDGRRKEPEQITAATKLILENLGESEFEEKRKS
jgi:hypothetical protein